MYTTSYFIYKKSFTWCNRYLKDDIQFSHIFWSGWLSVYYIECIHTNLSPRSDIVQVNNGHPLGPPTIQLTVRLFFGIFKTIPFPILYVLQVCSESLALSQLIHNIIHIKDIILTFACRSSSPALKTEYFTNVCSKYIILRA